MTLVSPAQFREWSGRTVAKLLARFGPTHLTLIEDSVQEAFLRALKIWPLHGLPRQPEAWLQTVAKNLCLDALKRPVEQLSQDETDQLPSPEEPNPAEIDHDDLALVALCLHPGLTEDAQLALALRELFGLTPPEIAKATRSTTEAVQQRLVRAKRLLAKSSPQSTKHQPSQLLKIAYLVFNEGYVATTGPELARPDLCADALRLVQRLLNTAPTPAAHALYALMLFHTSRLPSRIGPEGELRLLKDQDRTLWDKAMAAQAFRHLALSANGDELTPYHAEAAIASVHAAAPSYDQTDWPSLLLHYDDLARLDPSPVVLLNRAVVLAETHGPQAALDQLDAIAQHPRLNTYYLYPATRAEILTRLNQTQEAEEQYERAFSLIQNGVEGDFIQSRMSL